MICPGSGAPRMTRGKDRPVVAIGVSSASDSPTGRMRSRARPQHRARSSAPGSLLGRTPGGAQPLPKVLPALDFAPFDDDDDDSVFPAFDSADLLGLPMLLTPFRRSYLVFGPRGGATGPSPR